MTTDSFSKSNVSFGVSVGKGKFQKLVEKARELGIEVEENGKETIKSLKAKIAKHTSEKPVKKVEKAVEEESSNYSSSSDEPPNPLDSIVSNWSKYDTGGY